MAISLNDHENRIKNFEAKLPDISNRLDKIEASAADIFRFDMSSLGQFATNNSGWTKDITDMIPFKITANTTVTSDNLQAAIHQNSWSRFKHIGNVILSKNVNISFLYEVDDANRHTYTYFRFQNGRIIIGHSDCYFTRQTYMKYSGTLTFITSDKLYYNLSVMVSSLFKGVIQWLLV